MFIENEIKNEFENLKKRIDEALGKNENFSQTKQQILISKKYINDIEICVMLIIKISRLINSTEEEYGDTSFYIPDFKSYLNSLKLTVQTSSNEDITGLITPEIVYLYSIFEEQKPESIVEITLYRTLMKTMKDYFEIVELIKEERLKSYKLQGLSEVELKEKMEGFSFLNVLDLEIN